MVSATVKKRLPKRIRKLRDSYGMTTEQFGGLFGVSGSAVHHWESGVRQPSGACLIILEQLNEPNLAKWHLDRIH